jgi:hypothetical protein
MRLEYSRTQYNVPAEVGRRVTAYGKPGVITGAINAHIAVVLDDDPSEQGLPHHPTHEIIYGDMGMGKIRTWYCLAPWREEWERDSWFTVYATTSSKARYKALLELRDVCELTGKDMLKIRVRSTQP